MTDDPMPVKVRTFVITRLSFVDLLQVISCCETLATLRLE